MNIIFAPWAPDWLLITLAVGVVAITILSMMRNWKSGVFRALALIALLGLLSNPQIRQAERAPLEDIAIVLVDESASQSLDGRRDIASRARERLEETIGSLANVETRVVSYGGDDETRSIEALQSALADTPRARLGAVVMVTDGQSSDADDVAGISDIDAPVHIFLTGRNNEKDRKITLTNAPRYGIVRQWVRISFRIDDVTVNNEPLDASGQALVTLRVDGEVALSQPVPIGEEVGFNAPLTRPGRTVVELEVEGLDGELTDRNNIAVLPITAIRDRLRVLLISGEPHPGERVWRNLLKSDPAVDLVHFTILRPIEKNDGTPINELSLIPFPQDELFIDKLSEFDLLIFDRYTYRGVLSSFHFDNIARFVDGGGAVLIASGPEYNGGLSLATRRNLAFILPALPAGQAIERAFRPLVSDLGLRHPVTADLPDDDIWGRWLRVMPVTQLKGQTLMSGPNDAPLLILDRVGSGRVGLFLSDHPWLWARGFDGGGPHAELLRRIAHWLMKEPELEEEALTLTDLNGDLLIERRSMAETAPPVQLEYPDGETSEIELTETGPGKFSTKLENAPRGLYRARSGELFAIGAIGLAAPVEFQDVVADAAPLTPLADKTGGGVFNIRRGNNVALPSIRRMRPGSANAAGSDWAAILERKAARIDKINDTPLAPAFAWLGLIGAALLLAWFIESGRKIHRKAEQI